MTNRADAEPVPGVARPGGPSRSHQADPDAAPLTLRARHLATGDDVLHDGVVEVVGSRVLAVRPADSGDGEALPGWIVPGFVDPHVHGGGGHDYATTEPVEALAARDFHAAHGSTATFASLVTAPLEVLAAQLTTLAELVRLGEVEGIHLEGPFLSPGQKGAHAADELRSPSPAAVERLLEAADGTLRMVTIAPELPGALDAVRRFVAAGVHVAIGHTDADQAVVAAAVDAGADVGTHVFNAMTPIHHRRPGPVPQLLTDPRVSAELIADGFHLDEEVLRLALAAAGAGNAMLITDAMSAAGMPDGTYALGGLDVHVAAGQARLVTGDGQPGAIAGSTLTMGAAFERAVRLTGSIAQAVLLSSTNASRRFDLDAGTLRAGGRADLCVVDERGILQRVMRRGRWLEASH